MSTSNSNASSVEPRPRQRLSRENRRRQLLDVARRLIREEGSESLTLGRLAEQAGITKPVVYGHFETRSGLLAALYRDFDSRQTLVMEEAIATSESTLETTAAVIASSYVDCVLLQGREIPGVVAALAGSPELERIKREYDLVFIEKCRNVLAPFSGGCFIAPAGLWAMLGAAEALSYAAVTGEITAVQAKNELGEIILAMIVRSSKVSVSEL